MEIAKVIGSVWATKKDSHLNGQKLLVLKGILENGEEKKDLIVASDITGAGVGDLVLITHGGSARRAVGNMEAPVDVAVVGIVDSIEVSQT